MNFKKLLKNIDKWQTKTFPDSTSLSKIKHLKLEILELENNLEKTKANMTQKEVENILLEYADCFFLLFGSAFAYGLDFEDIKNIMKEKLEINKKRIWGKPDENGVVEHIK